ncbi:MAG TPA: ABC transporter permease [Bacteroidales bacterium]|nr:ABC transporter permease [Bacteroidales bacterium]
MLKNFFVIAFRFIWRNKTFSILNFLCLTFGLTCSLVAVLNIKRVTGYDKFNENYNRLYQVEANVTYFNGDRFPKENLSASLGDIVKSDIPEIESVARIVYRDHIFIYGNESFTQRGIYTDPDFLKMFSYPMLSGNANNPFENNSIIISERMAIKFFKSTDCIGKPLIINDGSSGEPVQKSYVVSGILKDVPSQSYIQFDFIIPFREFLTANNSSLEAGASAVQLWAMLNRNALAETVNTRLKTLIKNHEATLNQELFLFPLKEKMLYYYIGGRRVWGEMRNIVVISCLGFAILLIACFNFINLAIAQNFRRYREAGIKKVIGAQRSSIMLQYLGETFLLTFISLFTATELARIAVIGLNRAFNGNVQFDFSDSGIILAFLGIAVFTALVSGIIPALFLSSASPLNVLKGSIVTSHSFSSFRQGLIVFQFTIPIVLIIIMLIIKQQDGFLRHYDLGFDKNSLLIIQNSVELDSHAESIRTEMLSVPGIESVSFTDCIPARGSRMSDEVTWDGKSSTEKTHFWCINTDFNFDKIVNLKITAGRYFDKSHPADSACFLVNDIAAGLMGYKDPVGRSVTLDDRKGTVIGMFKDYRVILSGPQVPVIISISKEPKNNMLIKCANGNYSALNASIKDILGKYEPDKTYQPVLFRDIMSRTELTTVSNLIGLAFIISVLLACLGLAGLTSFTTAGKTKEIGIRKINGATVGSIMKLLGLNYTKWLLIATIISLPLSFLIGNMFLGRFTLRTPMPYWAFAAGPIIAYLIAVSSFALQCWKASTRNPVEALRYE